ncbi:MAG: NTPase [Archaeoglobus sp.]|nr:NTPase [Archaeoglobus sp.]
MRIAITGKPGSGKTTLCLKIFDRLKKIEGVVVSGIITKEVREKGRRVGFLFYDLDDGEEVWLAHVDNPTSVRVGRYGVFVENIRQIAKKFRDKKADVLIVDEIGPMELKSNDFIEAVKELMERDSSLIFTIHLRSKHPLLERIRREFKVFVIDEGNRDKLPDQILELWRELG